MNSAKGACQCVSAHRAGQWLREVPALRRDLSSAVEDHARLGAAANRRLSCRRVTLQGCRRVRGAIMNPITTFLVLSGIAGGLAAGYLVHPYVAAPFFVVAASIALSLKMRSE